VVSNIRDPEKRERIIKSIRRNSETVMKLFGVEDPEVYCPAHAENLAALEEEFDRLFVSQNHFPDILEFPWIGPANITYKALVGTPWVLNYKEEIMISEEGRISYYTHNDGKTPLFLIIPEKGATIEVKMKLIEEFLEVAYEFGVELPRVALLDFTEQYRAFMNTPSIRESRELVAVYKDSTDIILEGPMAYDLAVSKEAAVTKRFDSWVSGRPDALLTPEFSSGAMLKAVFGNWGYFGMPWSAADISFGGILPILVPSRSDSPDHKLRSIITAAYICQHMKG
jgi:hypothetical protein